MKKTICVLLALLLLLSVTMAACAKKEAEKEPEKEETTSSNPKQEVEEKADADEDKEIELESYRIGWLYYDLSVENFLNAKNAFENLGKDLNCEFLFVEANTPDYYMEAIENTLAAGVDAFVTCNTGNMSQQYMEACEAKGVYLAVADNDISADPGFKDITADNEYFAGWVYYDIYDTAYQTAELIAGMGPETFVIQSLPSGVAVSIDLRHDGWYDGGVENGMEFLGEGLSWNHADNAQNLLTQFPETQAYLTIGYQYVYGPMESFGLTGKIKVNGSECIAASIMGMERGDVVVTTEGVAFEFTLAFILAYNALTGHNLNPMDGSGGYINSGSFFYKSYDELMVWKEHMIENIPFTKENVSEVLGIYNPELTIGDLQTWADNWSPETFFAS